jgi:hypothetical protein
VTGAAEVCRFCGLGGFGCRDWPSPVICPDCYRERGDSPDAFDSWKPRAACRLAGLAGWWPDAAAVLEFRWACEAPPAGNRNVRWGHVDLDALRRRAQAWRPHARGWAMLEPTKEPA